MVERVQNGERGRINLGCQEKERVAWPIQNLPKLKDNVNEASTFLYLLANSWEEVIYIDWLDIDLKFWHLVIYFPLHIRNNTVEGGNLLQSFCKMFSASSTGHWAVLWLTYCPSKRGNFQKTYYKTFLTSCRHRLQSWAFILSMFTGNKHCTGI